MISCRKSKIDLLHAQISSQVLTNFLIKCSACILYSGSHILQCGDWSAATLNDKR